MKLFRLIFSFMDFLTLSVVDGDAGGGDGGTGDGDGGGAGAAGGTGAAGADWMAGFEDADKEYATNKGWDSPGKALASYRELEKFKGYSEDQVIRIPDLESASPEEMSKIFGKLGRPENAQGYELPKGENDGETEFKDWIEGLLYEMNAPKAAGQLFINRLNERQELMAAGEAEKTALQVSDDKEALRKEWGEAHDVQLRAAQNAAVTFGISPEQINALQETTSFMTVMKMFSSIAKGLGEDKYISGDSSSTFGGAMTPEAANDKIGKLQGDPNWSARYLNGDSAALAEMDRLQRYAAGGI